MIYTTNVVDDKHTQLTLSYADENVTLPCGAETLIEGDVAVAISYVPIFDADIRRIFAEFFPVPEIEMPEIPGGEE